MRSTIKQKNGMLDEIKDAVDLTSRKDALKFLYSNIAPAFSRYGFNLSHYLNGSFTITKDHTKYYYLKIDDLFYPFTTITKLNKG